MPEPLRLWWREVLALDDLCASAPLRGISGLQQAQGGSIHPSAILDVSRGPIVLGAGTRICEHATLRGPLVLGARCLVGKGAQVRDGCCIGNDVLIGQSAEAKRAILGHRVNLGPGSYAADSILEDGVFFAALVRTSNFRLDGGNVQVLHHGQRVDSGMRKLGCLVGRNTQLGIGCKIYPGREVPPDSLFEMDIHIRKNLPPGHYWLRQDVAFAPMSP